MHQNLVFSFCPPCKLVNARCSRLVTAQGWKLPSKSIPTAFHVFLEGLEPSLTDIILLIVLPHRLTVCIRLPRNFLLLFRKSSSLSIKSAGIPNSPSQKHIFGGPRRSMIPQPPDCKTGALPIELRAHSSPVVTGRSNTDPS